MTGITTPLEVNRVALLRQANFLAVDHLCVALDRHGALEAAMHAVIGQHVRPVLELQQIVDANDLDVVEILHRSAEHHAAKTIDNDFRGHVGSHFCWMSLSRQRRVGKNCRCDHPMRIYETSLHAGWFVRGLFWFCHSEGAHRFQRSLDGCMAADHCPDRCLG
jgi:hypothetical protein